jgi:hypothetical protein
VGKNQGGVDVAETRARKAKNKRAKIARYMGKYLGKELESWELNKKNYWHSKNVLDQEAKEIPIVLDANVSIWEAVEDVIHGQGAPGIVRRWSDLCARSGWAASW